MRWEDIQSSLRYKLGTLFPYEQSIRAIVRDTDSTLELFINWQGSSVDCWSAILRDARNRHLELELVEFARKAYPNDKELQEAENAITLLRKTESTSLVATNLGKQTLMSTNILTVFYTYMEEDEKLVEDLLRQLTVFKRNNPFIQWYGSKRVVSEELAESMRHLNQASVILLFVSPAFLQSNIHYEEVQRAMERHNIENIAVIPIILRPTVGWRETSIGRLQAIPRGEKAVSNSGKLETTLFEVAQEVKGVIETIAGIKHSS
jgi:TIR domain